MFTITLSQIHKHYHSHKQFTNAFRHLVGHEDLEVKSWPKPLKFYVPQKRIEIPI